MMEKLEKSRVAKSKKCVHAYRRIFESWSCASKLQIRFFPRMRVRDAKSIKNRICVRRTQSTP